MSKISVKNENFEMDESQVVYISVFEIQNVFEKILYIVNVKRYSKANLLVV